MEEKNSEELTQSINLTKPHITREDIQILLGGMKPRLIYNYQKSLVHKSLHRHIKTTLEEGGKVCDYFTNVPPEFSKKTMPPDFVVQPSSNERLEFLGDSMLNSIVSGYLYNKYPDKDEGFLTRLKTKIVRDTHCVKFSKIIGLGPFILAGNIVKKDANGSFNDKLLEDAFEAFLGAIYIDLGFKFINDFIIKLLDKHVNFNTLLHDDNYKDSLMRLTQTKGISLPEYVHISQNGPSHKRIFKIQIYLTIDNIVNKLGIGTGTCKKEAEQNAAMNTLLMIDPEDENLRKIRDRDL